MSTATDWGDVVEQADYRTHRTVRRIGFTGFRCDGDDDRFQFAGDDVQWYGAPENCFAFRRSTGGLVCVLNSGDAPVVLPPGDLLLSSAPLEGDGLLPANAAAWLVPRSQ